MRGDADTLLIRVLALRGDLRLSFWRACLADPSLAVAEALDEVCVRAEAAEPRAAEAISALVQCAHEPDLRDALARLREEAAGRGLVSLDRLLRGERMGPPARSHESAPPKPLSGRGGRELSLGERKSLARRGSRDLVLALLRDPHPVVIERALASARLTEDDVVRLAAARPGYPEALRAIARSHWVKSARVRLTLVLHPATPLDVAAPMVVLLNRGELRRVLSSAGASAHVRALSAEYLERRPPSLARRARGGSEGSA